MSGGQWLYWHGVYVERVVSTTDDPTLPPRFYLGRIRSAGEHAVRHLEEICGTLDALGEVIAADRGPKCPHCGEYPRG